MNKTIYLVALICFIEFNLILTLNLYLEKDTLWIISIILSMMSINSLIKYLNLTFIDLIRNNIHIIIIIILTYTLIKYCIM